MWHLSTKRRPNKVISLEIECITTLLTFFFHTGGSALLNAVDIAVIGIQGTPSLERRTNLFVSQEGVHLEDDDKQLVSVDYDQQLYRELIDWATKPGQCVLFYQASSGKTQTNLPPHPPTTTA